MSCLLHGKWFGELMKGLKHLLHCGISGWARWELLIKDCYNHKKCSLSCYQNKNNLGLFISQVVVVVLISVGKLKYFHRFRSCGVFNEDIAFWTDPKTSNGFTRFPLCGIPATSLLGWTGKDADVVFLNNTRTLLHRTKLLQRYRSVKQGIKDQALWAAAATSQKGGLWGPPRRGSRRWELRGAEQAGRRCRGGPGYGEVTWGQSASHSSGSIPGGGVLGTTAFWPKSQEAGKWGEES